jgi:hypothetical protein
VNCTPGSAITAFRRTDFAEEVLGWVPCRKCNVPFPWDVFHCPKCGDDCRWERHCARMEESVPGWCQGEEAAIVRACELGLGRRNACGRP